MPDQDIGTGDTGQKQRSWAQAVAAEALFIAFAAMAIAAAWYDFSVDRSRYISHYVNAWIKADPMVAFVGGCLVVLLSWIISVAWDIRFRYVLAIMAWGIVIGHLVWPQH